MKRLVFERRFDGISDRITRFSVEVREEDRVAESFRASSSAADFVNSGFATDSAGALQLFGPDAKVLLDPAFAEAYCFRQAPRDKQRPNQVGLAFAPARRKIPRVDVDGTLWVDTVARSLVDIVFRYVGLPSRMQQFSPGGRVSFRQMPNGIVLVDDWHLRGVVAEDPGITAVTFLVPHSGLSGIEFGGELAGASWPDGSAWHASLGTLRVHSLTGGGRPAAGTVIVLRDTKYSGIADSNGDIEIGDLAPGPYWLQVADPRLSAIDVNIPTPVTFVASGDSTFRTTLTVPTAEDYVVGKCVEMHQWKIGSRNLVLGRVTTPGGGPVMDANVTYEILTASLKWRRLSDDFITGSEGTFQSCHPDLSIGAVLRITVRREGAPDFTTVAKLDRRLTIVRVQVPAISP